MSAGAPAPGGEAAAPELSIVMPCLNEAETLERCIRKAQHFLERTGIAGEIIVADNGSDDGSPEIARRLGARVVPVRERGYGAALRAGIEAARGRYVVMGDADDSYDFSALDDFVAKLREGYDLVMGNRFRGEIRPGAMPWSHRWIGNPVLSAVGRLFFRPPVGDFHCGLRAFRKDAYERMGLVTPGMEFASEMVIKASLGGLRIAEVPIVLHPDGRSRPPHLRRWRDGWRHLRFMLLFSPRWLFLVPGIALVALGGAGMLWLLEDRRVGDAVLSVHTMLVCGVAALLGYQLVLFAVLSKVYAITEGLHPPSPRLDRLFRVVTLEVGLVAGAAMTLLGAAGIGSAVWAWWESGFGPLDPRVTLRSAILGGVLLVLGVQTIASSFFLSILGLKQPPPRSAP